MDKLDEAELEGIWRRIKHYIPVSRISGRNRKEVLESIERYMRDNEGAGAGNAGSMETLIKKGFATEDAFGRTNEFQSNLDKWIVEDTGIGAGGDVIEAPQQPELARIPKLNIFSSGRASVQSRSGKRVYSQKNLSVKFSEFKGKQSYYIYNTRTKKRLTWGVLNDD